MADSDKTDQVTPAAPSQSSAFPSDETGPGGAGGGQAVLSSEAAAAATPKPGDTALRFRWPVPVLHRRPFLTVWLAPDVTLLHGWSLVAVSFFTIGLLTFVTIGTNHVLEVNFPHIPVDDYGKINGNLAFWTEIVQIIMFGIVGVAADRVGRRSIFAFGMLGMGLGYFLYPFADSLTELTAYRIIYALGISMATGMLGTIITDYPKEVSRGRLVAVVGIMNGLGVVLISVFLGKVFPAVLSANGFGPVDVNLYMHWGIVALCVLNAAVIHFGLKGGTPTKRHERPPVGELFRIGLREGKNPRIALAYAAAFVARSDLVVLGTFTVTWGTVAAQAKGLPVGEGAQHGTILFITAQTAALLWAPVMGMIMDRFNRVTGLSISMFLAAIGYGGTILIVDPLSTAATPFFILLGIGQISAFFGATTLIGQEAPFAARGAVVGMFNVMGAIGILFSTKVGGYIFDHIAPAAPFVMIGLINGLIFLAAIYVRRTAPGHVSPEMGQRWRAVRARFQDSGS